MGTTLNERFGRYMDVNMQYFACPKKINKDYELFNILKPGLIILKTTFFGTLKWGHFNLFVHNILKLIHINNVVKSWKVVKWM